MAVSVQVGDPQRVAGFVQPGAEVALFVTIKFEKLPNGAEPPPEFTRLLLSRVQVIAVGPTTLRPPANAEDANKEVVPTAIMTLAVDQAQAQRLVFAATKANLYFALLAKDSKVGPSGAVDIRNLFS
jgi:pilus assembly protein CpaB